VPENLSARKKKEKRKKGMIQASRAMQPGEEKAF
jgi:hypothetical protein